MQVKSERHASLAAKNRARNERRFLLPTCIRLSCGLFQSLLVKKNGIFLVSSFDVIFEPVTQEIHDFNGYR
jgi:hypothetical protein